VRSLVLSRVDGLDSHEKTVKNTKNGASGVCSTDNSWGGVAESVKRDSIGAGNLESVKHR